jgi:SHAQKYF class myb-like DNA-binding protein
LNIEVFTVNQNKGKWTQAEHEAFLKGFELYGNNWNMISTIVTTRTSMQIKTHAQKYHASLLPDSRACMLENNAEAQRKH